ncbi:MAG: hypothetical protein VR72_14030 [Clostridiaceae bacterium BRH_c20a]|nr:MAG: hypothetical protein VR72_14030 [Clostridiaceae bacterium BRH_c20a]
MKRFIILILINILLISSSVPTFATEIIPQFKGGGENHSHQFLVEKAVNILNNDGKTNAYNELFGNLTDFKAAADWPDDYQHDNYTWKGHFYHAVTHLNWANESDPTAMTRFLYYMNLAKQYYDKNNTNNETAIIYLGRAMHYFADLNAPHHVANLTALDSWHDGWESFADTNKNNFVTSYSTKYNAHGTNFEAYGEESADYAYNYVSDATATIPGSQGTPDTNRWYNAADKCYKFCQNNMAAVLDAFFRSEGVY